MEELRLSHAWPPLARFCAAAAFFVGVSVMMIGCGGGGSPPVDSSNPEPRVTSTDGKVTLTISSPVLAAGATILPADQVSLSISHLFGAKARYELEQPRSSFFAADPDNGEISLVRALPVGNYALTLRLIYEGLTATRSVDVRYPIAFGQANDIEILSTDITMNVDAYTLSVRAQSPRTISIAVEGGGGSLTVTQDLLTFVAGERSKPVTLQAAMAINDIFAADNSVVTLIFGLRDVDNDSITSSLTIRFISEPRVASTGETFTLNVSPRTILPEGATILPTESAGLIFHLFDAKARYELEQPERPQPPYFAADPDSGKIWLARDLPIGDSTLLTLRMIHRDLTATLFVEVRHLVLPVAVDLANDIAILPSGLGAGRVAYTFNVQSRDRRTISIAVEGGVGYFEVAPNLLNFDVGERSKPVTILASIAIDEIFKVDNRTVNMTFGLRDVADPLAATRFTIGFISQPRVTSMDGTVTVIRPRTSLTAGATILPTASVALSIFHLHGATARYELEQPQPPLGQSQSPYFAADLDNGKITLARALPVGDYTLTLRLIYEGLTATRSVSVRSEYLEPDFVGNITNEIYFPPATGADAEVLQITVTGDDVTVFVDSQSLPIRARPATVREDNVVYRVEFESPLASIITRDKQRARLTLRAQGALMEPTKFPTVAFMTVDILSGPIAFGRDDTLIIPAGGSGVALPAGAAGITIWHIALPTSTNYKIDQSDDNLLFTVDVKSGEIAIVDVLENRSEHDLTLRMIGFGYESVSGAITTVSVTASRPLRIIGPPHQTVFISDSTHTITVAAMAQPGEEIAVVRSSVDRAPSPPFVDFISLAPVSTGDFRIDGGVTSRIRLGKRGALELFTADGTELSVDFQGTDSISGESRVVTLVFRSAPLVAENGDDLLAVLESARVTTADVTVVTAAEAGEADIWHFPTPEMIAEPNIISPQTGLPVRRIDEEYSLSQVKATNLDRLDESTFSTGLFSVDGETGEVIAAATLEYNRAYEFVLYLRGGGVEAFRNVRVETPPYPSFYAQENVEKGEGTEASPHLIYDIYQLQAIDGAMPADVAAALAARWRVSEDFVQNEAAETFGEGRLTLRYRLAGDIDASPTRAWAQGFGPIGGSEGGFDGVFDGFSFLIRELHIRRPLEDDVGLFAALESSASVFRLGLQNVEILGDARVGGFAGAMRGGALSVNWISGLVSGGDDVGGFAGWQASGILEENWSSARVDSGGDGGGWVGLRAAGDAGRGYWAGVFAGDVSDFSGRNNLGALSSPLGAVGGEAVFWNPQASAPGLAQSGGGAVAVGAIQGLLSNDFGGGWRAGVGGARDFPVLLDASGSEQAIGVALGMTRLVGIENGEDVILRPGANGARIDLSPEFGWLRLDTNGFIARDVADFASARCEVYNDDEGLPRARAATGYNGVEILVDLLAEDALLSYSEECRFGWSGVERNADVTLRLILTAPAVAAGGVARQTIDYAARFAATDISGFDSPAFLTGLPRGVVTIGAAAAANTYSFTVTTRDPVLLGTTMEISSGAAVESAVGVLETGGGRIAAITLAMEATALFTEDNAEAKGNVVLVEGGQRQPHEVRFVSGPRAISFIDGDVFTVHLPARVPRLVDDLRDRLQVWHYEGETYSITVLGAADVELFTLDGSRVSVVGGGLLPGLYTIDVEVEGGDEVAGDDVSLSGRMIVDVAPPTYAARAVTVAAGLPPDQAIITLAVADGVLKRNSFAFLPFDEDMFSTGGGEEAVITMNRDQASFADDQIFTLALTLSQDGRAIIASVEVRSAPSFEPLAAFEGSYSVPVFTGETAAGNGVTISIGFRHLFGATPDPSHFWISGAATNYFRLGADLDLEHIRNVFFSDLPVANGAVGSITVSGALSYDDGGSLVAGRETREFQIAIGFAGDGNDESVAIAVDDLVSTIKWTETNAYDYTHTVSVTIGGSATITVIDLREVGDVTLDGSSEAKAFPIFNIWQLQAIDGREVVNGTLSTDNFTLFGMDDSERLSQHYRIMNDIDATPLANVVHVHTVTIGSVVSGTNRRPRMAITSTITAGFSPIGEELLIVNQFDELDESTFSPSFTGGLYGDGFVVSGLRFVSSVIYNRYPAGLITRLGGGGLISGVRLEDAIVAAFPNGSPGASAAMGGLVALQQTNSKIVASRFSGDVFVYPDNNAINIGGLVGNSNNGVIIDSSSSGRVGVNSSSAESVGGLVGTYHLRGKIIRSWSSADVGGSSEFGGLVGFAHIPGGASDIETSIEGVWSAGRLTRSANSPGGLYYLDPAISGTFISPVIANVWTASEVSAGSYPLGRANGNLVSLGYWSRDLAPVGYRIDGSSGEGVDDIRTLNPSHFSGDLWDFGTDSDFPLLNNQSRSEQAAQIASGISKIVGRNGGTVVLGDDLSIDHLTRGASFILGSAYAELELDTNGLASGANDMPAPSCEFSNNEVRANTNYNNAAVAMTLISSVTAMNWVDRGACAVSWEGATVSKLTVRMIVSSTYGTETTILTIDYPAEIADESEFATPPPLRIEAFAERELIRALDDDGVLLLSLRGGVNGEDDIIVRATGNGKVTILPIPSGDNFHTDGGVSWATISVFNAGSNDIFSADNQLRSVVVSVSDSGGQVSAVTLTLAAIPELVFNDFSNLTINLPVSRGRTILAAGDYPVSWKHALYGLSRADPVVSHLNTPFLNFFEGELFPLTIEASGRDDADISNDHYIHDHNKMIFDPAVLSLSVRYDVIDYKGISRTNSARSILTVAFVDSTEAFSLRRTFDGAAYPWTRDEAYSYRVTMQGENGIVEVDLLQLNEDTSFDGSFARPIPIYNVWQLQAIAGVSVNAAGSVSSSGAVIFGSNRLDLHYRLMNDIDADPAREWDGGKGFTPIGDPADPFLGIFNGGGNVVQNLFIDRATITIGLFGAVGEDGGVVQEGFVWGLGVSNAEYRGSGDIGGVIGLLAGRDNSLNQIWFSGRIFQSSPSHYAGGVVGRQRQEDTSANSFASILLAWAAGEIEVAGGPETAGGIVGLLESNGNQIAKNHLEEVVSYIASPIGGVYGSVAIDPSPSDQAYVSREISALPADPTGTVVESLQAGIGLSLFNEGTNNDFPVFRNSNLFSPSQQAINIAAGLTRIRDKDGTALALDGTIPARNFGRMQLDTNGLAANDGSDQTATPDCVFVDDALRAQTNYNQVVVMMTLLAAPTGVYFSHRGGCEVFWVGANENVTATVRLIFSSAVAADALTVDYIVRPDDSLPFVTPNEIIVPADYQPEDSETDPFRFIANPEYTRINVADSDDFAAIDGVAQDGTLSVRVLRSATSIFDYDNAVKVIALELTNLSNGEPNEEEPYTQEISARSSPRLASSLDALFVNLPVIAGGTLAAKPLEIWHLDDEGDEFRIVAADGLPLSFEQNGALISTLDINEEDGHTIRVEAANGTLTLPADGVIQFVVGEHERLRRALAATIRWTPENAYNYEFAVTNDDGEEVMIDLRVLGDNVLDGLTPRLPFPIYNIWQLQAANGAGELPPDALTLEFSARERASVLFGANAEERLGRHYRLMSDIDAYPTRNWGDSGFIPLGDADTPFAGSLDGDGNVVRGLYSRHNDASMMGVLAGAVSNLGIEDALIIADGDDAQIGALAASVAFGGRIEGSWATGRGDGGDSADYSFGGLAGAMAPGTAIEGSWAAVDMTDAEGRGDSAGGLVGELNGIESQHATLRVAWSAGDIAVDDIDRAGGALGFAGFRVSGVWSVSEVEANESDAVGGFVGVLNAPTDNAFWSPISGVPDAVGGIEGDGDDANIFGTHLQALELSQIGDGFDVGGALDFPLITLFEHSKVLQVAHLARALTQIKGVGDAAFPRYVDAPLRLSRSDYPYLSFASDDPIESCVFEDGAITAELGYNGAMTRLSLPSPGASGARFTGFSADRCLADLPDAANNAPFIVRWEIWSENEKGYTLTVDYSVSFESPQGEIELPEGEIVVPAFAVAGDPVLTLHFPGGTLSLLSPIGFGSNGIGFVNRGFGSDGGDDLAVITLTRDARDRFSGDNEKVTLAFTVTGESRSQEAQIVFRSAPLAIAGGANSPDQIFFQALEVMESQAIAGYQIDIGAYLSIWHNDDANEFYAFSQPYDDFEIDRTGGTITARREFVGDTVLTLRVIDAVTDFEAKFFMLLRVVTGDDAVAKVNGARRVFERMIERGEVNWLEDSDADGTINAYDWTPDSIPDTVVVNLIDDDLTPVNIVVGMDDPVEVDLLGDADGTEDNPWPIYNVWQLQAIGGISVSADGVTVGGLQFFGDGDNLSEHYRLMSNIDATPTRAWDDGKGFSPIGDSANPFIGDFDGNGKAVKGIYIDRALDQIGIFAVAEDATIVSLGVADGRIGGEASVAAGGIVGEARSVEIIDSWFSGRIDTAGDGAIGGLAGILTISADANKLAGAWVAGRIESSGAAAVAGGVIGKTSPSTAAIEFPGVWSVAEVMAVTVGGVIGEHARPVIDFSRSSSITAYWSVETSGVDNSDGNSAGIRTAQTLRAAQISATDGDGADVGSINDFPLLNAFSRARQAVNIAAGLTRILPRDGGVERGLPRGYADLTTLAAEFRVLEFDSNGLAANDVSARSSAPSCVFADGGLRAATNYNNVAVSLSLLSDSGASLRDIGTKGDCLFGWRDVRDETALTLRAVFSSDYDDGVDSVRSTFDYRLTIAAGTAERLNDSSAVNDESAVAAIETTKPARAFAEALANDYLPRVYGGIGVADSPLLPLPVETTFPPTGDVVLRIDDDDNPNTALACAANSGGLSARSQHGALILFTVENADGESCRHGFRLSDCHPGDGGGRAVHRRLDIRDRRRRSAANCHASPPHHALTRFGAPFFFIRF